MRIKVLFIASLFVIGQNAFTQEKKHTGELLYKLKKTDLKLNNKKLNAIYEKYGVNKESANKDEIGVLRISYESQDLESTRIDMIKSGAFEFVEYNTIEHELGDSSSGNSLGDPKISKQYHHRLIDTINAWSVSKGEGVVVAVCDSGVEYDHEDLKNNVKKTGAWDFVDNDSYANPATSHGTFVAGLIAATAENGVGIAGVAPKAKILPLRIATSKGSTTLKTISDCIRYAADQGAKIINVSFTGVNSAIVADAGKYANKKGSLLIYSSGNSGINTRWKNRKYVLAVGASNARDYLWRIRSCTKGKCRYFGSNAGYFVDIVTPGHNIFSTNTYVGSSERSKYRSGSGTSYSAPILSGIAALVASVRPDLGPLEIEDILKKTTDKIGSGSKYYYGAGRANAYEAVKYALDY